MVLGLQLLNETITTNNIAGNNWTLLTTTQYTVNAGEDTLTLDGWAKILSVRFLLGNVWFTIKEKDLNSFLNEAVLPNSSGVPFIRFAQRTATGYLLRFFQVANQTYTFEVWGYAYVPTFNSIYQTLDGFNDFYKNYYLYELAYRLQSYFDVPHTPEILSQRNELRKQLKEIRQDRIDIEKSATSKVGTNQLNSVAALNLSQGYTPS